MAISRRALLSHSALIACATILPASADTATYTYDPLGRLVRVAYASGVTVVYTYDAAGNRLHVIRTDGSTYSATLQVTGTGPVNLRDLADNNGYSGITNATITFQVGSAITISGAPGSPVGGIGIDTGTWPADKTISLTLQVSGKVYGGGGRGGQGAGSNGNAPSNSAGAGGHAIYCRQNISITVNSGGQVKGGGGGGGGGGGWWHQIEVEGQPTNSWANGGGGGGGFPNGPGGPEGEHEGDYSYDVANPGSSGTTSAGGAGGTGGTFLGGGGRVTGAGGAGAGAAGTGSTGADSTGTNNATYNKTDKSAGAGPGYAIYKNGKTVPVTNNGTITGTVG